MKSLSDTQRILLSNAAQRCDVSVLPLPSSLRRGGGTAKALAALIKRGFAEERETPESPAVHRTETTNQTGLYATAAGLAAIGINIVPEPVAATETLEATASSTPRGAKTDTVLALLAQPGGASLTAIIGATGWLPHSTRAALAGLRKKGHRIECGKQEGATWYRLVTAE